VDVKQIDRIVLVAMGLRVLQREPQLQEQVNLFFSKTDDSLVREGKGNIADHVFGRLGYEAANASMESQKNTFNPLYPLGSELRKIFGHMTDWEAKVGQGMARMARRRMRVLSEGTQSDEREDGTLFRELKKWVDKNKDVLLSQLEKGIKDAFFKPDKRPLPWAKPAGTGVATQTQNQGTGKQVSPQQATLSGTSMNNSNDLSVPPPPQDPGQSAGPATGGAAGGSTGGSAPEGALGGQAQGGGGETGQASAAPAGKPRASAWKFVDVPADEPDPKPYTEPLPADDKRSKSACGLPVVAARVRGKKHKHEGTNGDDAFDIGSVGNWTILAVSDGAGSCRFSRVGSQAACGAAVELLQQKLAQSPLKDLEKKDLQRDGASRFENAMIENAAQALQDAMQEAHKALEVETANRQTEQYQSILKRPIEIKDLSCTLLLAIHIPVVYEGKEYDFVMGCQVGDGMIAVVSKAGGLVLLATADTGAFSGETDFITSKNKMTPEVLRGKVQLGLVHDMRALMAMTDGVADDYFPNDPGMLRCFGDLCLNGVVQFEGGETPSDSAPAAGEISTLSERLISAEGDPEEVRIFSVESYAQAVSKTVDEVMKMPHEKLAFNAGVPKPMKSGSEQLMIWLDSYQVRGSFDDRALAMIYSTEASKEVK
jgi:hypothetical protein